MSEVSVMWGDYDRMHEGYGFGWFALIVLLLVLVGLAVALLVVMLRSPGRGGSGSATGSTTGPNMGSSEAALILRRRFAAGEIDEDEFRRRLSALSDS
ncbi:MULTISPECIES: SHOCT domain-containing protein [Nocardioides]|jgi:putative membrane protein|nr:MULTISPECIES: SHOCT domain-containing protein [Nocardioides]